MERRQDGSKPQMNEPSSRDLPLDLRPDPGLLRYYFVTSLVAGPLFFIPFLARYFRYRTLRYHLDAEGVSMRWGVLSQREIVLNFARIQDIHLTSNVVERWLGLAKIHIQTASGSASAEMVLEGLEDPEEMRDFLYSRMRGGEQTGSESSESSRGRRPSSDEDALVAALSEVAAELRALRADLNERLSRAETDP